VAGIYDNEAQSVDLDVIKRLENDYNWMAGDSLLYQNEYKLTPEQQQQYAYDGKLRKSIKPDIVLIDPISHDVLAVFENKLDDEKKALGKLRLLYSPVLKPRFLYACSKERILFYDNSWSGLDAGEFRRVNGFMSLEEMKIKIDQQHNIQQDRTIEIDTSIAGGFDSNIGKDRYYQKDCIEALIDGYRGGSQKMLVHMATGLGKTRIIVALSKTLLGNGLAKKILFVVDRRILARQALNKGFALISREHTPVRLRTSNYRQLKHAAIHVVVIDTLERIFQEIPSNFYDLLVVDECHRSITVNRKLIFDHFLCPRIGLTATPKEAIAKQGANVTEEDLAIQDTYKLFGCDVGEPTYQFDLDCGIDEEFLAEYNVEEILTHLTKEAEQAGIPIDYVLNPDTRQKIDLPQQMRLKLEQLERKYLSEERCMRIAEEIRNNVEWGEKVIVFGVSQVHCQLLAQAFNKVYKDEASEGIRYAEPVISENDELNDYLKSQFEKFNRPPYIVTSVDIMTTGVDVPCVRFISFAALTKSVGKYIQMLGRGTRLDPKTGKFSFKILDFTGLCRRMKDNRKGTTRPNKKVVTGSGGGGRGGRGRGPKGPYFIIDNPDPVALIQRVYIHGDNVSVIDNIPIEKARDIFESEAKQPKDENIQEIKGKLVADANYEPTEQDLSFVEQWLKKPEIYLDEAQLQRIYEYPHGSVWDFMLHAMGIKKIPTPKERIEKGFEAFLGQSIDLTDQQIRVLQKMKDVFATNLSSHQEITMDTIFSNPIYEKIIGRRDKIEKLFDGHLANVMKQLKSNFQLSRYGNVQ
jgi:superfamily II DNA or RNA helicase